MWLLIELSLMLQLNALLWPLKFCLFNLARPSQNYVYSVFDTSQKCIHSAWYMHFMFIYLYHNLYQAFTWNILYLNSQRKANKETILMQMLCSNNWRQNMKWRRRYEANKAEVVFENVRKINDETDISVELFKQCKYHRTIHLCH